MAGRPLQILLHQCDTIQCCDQWYPISGHKFTSVVDDSKLDDVHAPSSLSTKRGVLWRILLADLHWRAVSTSLTEDMPRSTVQRSRVKLIQCVSPTARPPGQRFPHLLPPPPDSQTVTGRSWNYNLNDLCVSIETAISSSFGQLTHLFLQCETWVGGVDRTTAVVAPLRFSMSCISSASSRNKTSRLIKDSVLST